MLAHLIQKRKPLLPFGVAIAVSLGLGAIGATPALALSPSSIRIDSQDGVDVGASHFRQNSQQASCPLR